MGSMVFRQDQQKSLRGSYYNQNLPISLYQYSSIHLPYQQPPLLPLPQIPNAKPPPTTQPKVPMARPRSQSLFTPKKSKPPSLNRSSQLENKRVGRRVSDKHIMRSVSEGASKGAMDDYSGFIFSVSPHPSSLPLPKFPLPARAKAGGTCKADAGVDDSVTTDGLRRLLHLR